ncbi:hypothetical protein ACHAQA_004405 [Verticillium albo-atrum]
MAKKKTKQPAADESKADGSNHGDQAQPLNTPSSSGTTRAANSPDNGAALIICRNKHWRFISSFHGPWLQLPFEILETIANINYNTPRPHPIDPALFFDVLKIRRLVDEATNLAVRAANDNASPNLTNGHGRMNGRGPSSLGFGMAGHGAKLSRERRFRMREQACQKLARAYRLDEIACSVATMQGTSILDEIGSLVLQRNPDNPDAKYVHVFHEKIPSRQLAESTSLVPLNEIVDARPMSAETWRTRAAVRVFKQDYEGAMMDLTQALQLYRFHRPPYQDAPTTDLVLANGRRPHDVILTEEQQPSSLEKQVLFQRASVYLTWACKHIADGLPEPAENGKQEAGNATGEGAGVDGSASNGTRERSPAEKEAYRRALDHRKLVKTYAKRALRDFTSYLSHLDYTPCLPLKVTMEFAAKTNLSLQGSRHPRLPDSGVIPAYKTYTLADLFTAVPPSDLPPFPPGDTQEPPPALSSSEAVTYHPLLTDALHSLLLCHCLIQTSSKELLRHAHMVARIARLADGYPVFSAPHSPARADWLEVVRRANNWIQMSSTWEQLCAPAPLPLPEDQRLSKMCHPAPDLAAAAAAAITRGDDPPSTAEIEDQERRERVRQQAILESLEDERVIDEATFDAAVTARQNRAEEDFALLNGTGVNSLAKLLQDETDALRSQSLSLNRWGADDSKNFLILSDRAAAVARWVVDAPAGAGGTRRKRKGAAAKKGPKAPVADTEGVAAEMEKLAVGDGVKDKAGCAGSP